MGIIDQVRAKPTLDTSWEAFRDKREIPNGLYLFSKVDPPEVVAYYLQNFSNQGVYISEFIVDWLPEHPPNFMKRMREPYEKSKKEKKAKLGESSGSRPPVPLVGSPGKFLSLPPSVKIKPIASSLPQTTPIYTSTETPPSTTRSSNPSSLKFNLTTTTLLVSEAEMLNETTSPSPQSPPYYELSSNTEPSDPQSPTLAQLQARTMASQQPSHPEPEPEVTSPPPEHPNPTTSEPQPTHSEPQPFEPTHSNIPSPITSADLTTPTLNLSSPISPSSPSPASATEPETTLPTLEKAIQVFAESLVEKVKSLTINSGISYDPSAAEAKDKADAEEVARIAEEVAAKANADELTQGEHSNSGFVPLVLKTLEELQKEQQIVRARLDQQDSINVNIQNMLS
ncbi:extensin-like [Lathyrus oleraceus]|uniref:extensin-like n=1 Tax=Pisum sativum TaxID=3888 RepID=UPI0021D2FD7D|nr:extensin-like [Pisum sativum]